MVKSICDTCKCNEKLKTIDCEDLQLRTMFSTELWVALENSTDLLDTVRYIISRIKLCGRISNTIGLSFLRLDNNIIRNVTIFPKLAIRVLNLRENKIETIARYAFRDLAQLEVLDLSSNWLSFDSLRPEVFEGNYDPVVYEPLKKLKVEIN